MTDPADTQMSHQPPVGPVDHPEATPPGQPAAPTLGSPAAGFDAKGRVRRTRISGVWVGGADHRCSVSDLAGGVHRAEHRLGVNPLPRLQRAPAAWPDDPDLGDHWATDRGCSRFDPDHATAPRSQNATRHPTSESSDNGEQNPTSRQPTNFDAGVMPPGPTCGRDGPVR
jgi:hypothetical protein